MKKAIYLTILLIFSIPSIQAQDFDFGDSSASSPFVVMHVKGTAKYLGDEKSNTQEVVSGMILPEKGTLTLSKKSQLKLSWKSQTVVLNKKGTYSLKNEAKKLADSGDANSPPADDFMMELGASSGFGDTGGDGDDDRDSGASHGDTTGGSGWGTREFFNAIMPIGGIVPKEAITISWAGISGDEGFRVNLFKGTDEKPVLSAMTKNNSFTLDVSQLTLAENVEYSWQVEDVLDPAIKSEKVAITFGNKDQDMEVVRGMLSDREYSYSDPWLKLLREAHALQKENMLYAANEKYKQGLNEFADNQTIKKMYARFLTKHGLKALADEVLK